MLKKICGLIFFPLILSFASFIYVRSRVPNDITLTKGVVSPVKIIRDSWGIPTITAENTEDGIYGLGYAMATDRLWQIDMTRRMATGRLSEVLGEKGLEMDKFTRNIKVHQQAERDLREASVEGLALLKAFAAGINAAAADQWLPLEYYITRSTWEEFLDSDSQAVLYLMSLALASTWGSDLLRYQLFKIVGEQAYWILPHDISVLSPLSFITGHEELPKELKGEEILEHSDLAEDIEFDVNLYDFGSGSNSWIVSGNHTKSGMPILANDPHLSASIPSLWYLHHLKLPGNSFSGASTIGSPIMPLGRNKNFVWGVTALKSDIIDVFVEKIEGDFFLYDDSYVPLTKFQETIKVKNQEPVVIEFKETVHGPILENSFIGANRLSPVLPIVRLKKSLSFSWTVYHSSDKSIELINSMAKARKIEDIREAFSTARAASLAVLIGSKSGDIYFQSCGAVPIRKVHGNLPIPGWLSKNTWAGLIPFSELPYSINPEKGFIVTANNFPADASYKYFSSIGKYFAKGRSERLTEVIEQKIKDKKKMTAKDFIEMQKDEFDVVARETVEGLIGMIKDAGRFKKEVEELKTWDFVLGRNSKNAAIYLVWSKQIMKNLLIGKVPEDMLNSALKSVSIFRPFERAITKNPEKILRLCDDPVTDHHETCEDLVTKSFIEACERVNQQTWGEMHEVVLKNLPFSQVPILKHLYERKFKVGGCASTVHASHFDWSLDEFFTIHGPGLKFIADLGNDSENYWSLEAGTNGNPFNPHYADMLENFHYGDLIQFTYEE